jgi:hypothetical protein
MSSLLPQGQPKGIPSTTLLDGFLHIPRHTVEPVRRAGPVNALMGPLMIIEAHNPVPPNTKFAKCTIPGILSSAGKFMFMEASASWAAISVGVVCRGRRIGLASKYQLGCLIEPIALV